MFAVIKTGGKQYRVVADDQFTIERLPGEAGDAVSFEEVLMVGTTIGAPFVSGASVAAEIVEQVRGPKVISFKKRRRQNSKRTRGHRQDLTLIRISEILTDGKKASKTEKRAKTAAAETASVTDEDLGPKAEKPKAAAKPASKKADEPKAATAKAEPKKAETKKPAASKKKTDDADKA